MSLFRPYVFSVECSGSQVESGLAKLDERFFGFSKVNPEFFRGAQ